LVETCVVLFGVGFQVSWIEWGAWL
jgi:hypothetical protein